MKTLRYSKTEGLAHITLDRGDGLNAKDDRMGAEFREVVADATSDQSVRCLLLDAAGRNFCAGGDLRLFVDDGDIHDRTYRRATNFHSAVSALYQAPWPIVVAVQGGVVGGGLSFVGAADIVIAADDAHFRLPYVDYGLVPDGGITWWLPRVVGARKAAEMCLLGVTLSASEAHFAGLVTSLVSRDDLEAISLEVAHALSRKAGDGASKTAQLLRSTWQRELGARLEEEALAVSTAVSTPEAQEKIREVAPDSDATRHPTRDPLQGVRPRFEDDHLR